MAWRRRHPLSPASSLSAATVIWRCVSLPIALSLPHTHPALPTFRVLQAAIGSLEAEAGIPPTSTTTTTPSDDGDEVDCCPASSSVENSSSVTVYIKTEERHEHYVELRPLELRGMSGSGKCSNPMVSIEAVPDPSTWDAEWLERIRALTPVDLVG